MAYEVPPLPYAYDALEPHISKETLEYHYGKHHKTYVDKLNDLIKGTEFESAGLEDIIRKRLGKAGRLGGKRFRPRNQHMGGDINELCKTAVPVHSENLAMRAKMRVATRAADAITAWHN